MTRRPFKHPNHCFDQSEEQCGMTLSTLTAIHATIQTERSVGNQDEQELLESNHTTVEAHSGRRIQGEQTKELIVEAACDLIGESGYHSVTAAALIERAGVSKGGLYHHFRTLDDVIIKAYEKTAWKLFSGLGTSNPASVGDYLQQVEQVIFQHLLTDKRTLRIMHELLPMAMYDPLFIERRQKMMKSGADRMIDKFAPSFKNNIKESELQKMIAAVSVFISGLAIQHQMSSDLKDSRKTWAWFRSVIQKAYGDVGKDSDS